MRSSARWAALVAAGLGAGSLEAQTGDDVPLFVVARTPTGIALRTEFIGPGQTRAFRRGGSSEVVDVVFPVGPGRSGNLVALGEEAAIVVRRVGDELELEARVGERTFPMPARRIADLRGEDIRVSVVIDEARAVFEVRGWAETARDTIGPVDDLFAGQLPAELRRGNALITTETRARATGPPARGSAPLELGRYAHVPARHGAAAGAFVVDLGATSTVVARDFLPANARIEPSSMVQYSAAGRRELEDTHEGATGPVRTLGNARLDSLVVGDIVFRDATVSVVDRLPAGLGDDVRGILGIDLLRRGHLTLDLASAAAPRRLTLTAPGAAARAVGIRVPFSLVHDLVCVRAVAEGVPVPLLLDSGAPETFLDSLTAAVAGVRESGSGADVYGMGGQGARARPAVIAKLAVGGWTTTAVPCRLASLSVLRTLRGGDQPIGLLGLSTLARLKRLEIDFESRVLTLVP